MLLVAALVITSIVTILSLKRGVRFGVIVQVSFFCSVISIPVVSLVVGTFYSHGFDIPAWVFGVIIALAIVLVAMVNIGLYKLVLHVRKET